MDSCIDAARARSLCEEVLVACGAPQGHAMAQSAVLIEGDLRGRPSHGLQRLPTVVGRIENGLLDPRARPELEWRAPAFLAVDANDGLGCVAADHAIGASLEAAERTGVVVAAIRRGSHLGMLAPYVERIAAAGRVGIVLTTSEALVHPAGGRSPLIGTNPIGVGVPAAPEPFVLDMSTAAISAGEVLAHARRGEELPPGRAIDADGAQTTDPELALAGSLSPFGGAKGYALALAVQLLVGWASTTGLGTEVRGTLDAAHPVTKGDVIVVFDPSACKLPNPASYVSAYLNELRAAPTAPNVACVAVPGDRMRAERLLRLQEGIRYPASLWCELERLRDRVRGVRRA